MATSSTPTAEWKPSQGASIASIAIGAALAAVYFALAQANLTFDGAMYLVDPRAEGQPQKLFHLAFHLYLPATLALGRALGLSAPAAGAAQSALLAAAGVAVAHWAMRRESISPAPAATFALALGLSPTVLENATIVDL
jgi:hypothetical protein